ncbi:hypothetical protein HYT59_02895, partial [Candidatus Woesebacteria bacterium]|nr:hypothetical protein [Candidatus Woesebacteria bacterium]
MAKHRLAVFLLFFFIFSVFSFFSLFVPPASAYYTNMDADVVIGQPDFTSGSANQGGTAGASTINQPTGVAYDASSKKLIVSDFNNHRILIYNQVPTSNNAPADVVIGQTNFTSTSANQGGGVNANTLSFPFHIAVVGGRLIVADGSNNRVLIYNSIPSSNNTSADVVVGQADFTSNGQNQGQGTSSAAANTLRFPRGVYSDGTKLFISDGGNSRVLIYNSIPTSNNVSADIVVGQPDFTSRAANQGGTAAANTLSNSDGDVIVINNKLVVADHVNHRVLIFNQIPTTNNVSADVVLGQVNFSTVDSTGTTGANSTRRPIDLVSDGTRLFIATNFSSRVIVHNSIPTVNTVAHDISIGQPNLTDNTQRTTANGMWGPVGLALAEKKLIVADNTNNRILIFNNIISTPIIGLYPFPESAGNGRLRMRGNVRLGEWGRYSLSNSKMEVSVNRGGYGAVSSLYGNR